MRRRLFAALCVASAFVSQWAVAADLSGQPSLKDQVTAPRVGNWTGLYVGGHVGLATGNTTGRDPALPFPGSEYDMNGGLYGGHAGYNFQFNQYVLGVEGTFDGTSLEGSTSCGFGIFNCRREADWIGTLVARAGFLATPNTLIYGMGGVAWGKLKSTLSFPGFFSVSGSDTHTGWTAGVGIEQAFGDRITGRIEYSHIDLGSETTLLGGFIPDRNDAEFDTLRLGVSIKLTE